MAGAEVGFPSCLEPLQTALRALGLEAFQVTSVATRAGGTMVSLQRSTPATVYATFITTVLALVHVRVILDFLQFSHSHFTATFTISYIAIVHASTIASLVAIASMYFNHNARQEILQTLVKVDQVVLINIQECYKNSSKRISFLFISTFAGLFFSCVIHQVCQNLTAWGHVISCTSHIREFITYFMTTYFINMTLFVKQRLEFVNDQLREVLDNELMSYAMPETYSTQTEHTGDNSLWQSNIRPRNAVDEYFQPDLSGYDHERRVKILHSLKVVHNALRRIIDLLNSVHGTPLFFNLISAFMLMTTFVHNILVGLFRPSYYSAYNTTAFLASSVTWFTLQTAQMVAVIAVCSGTTRQARATHAILQHSALQRVSGAVSAVLGDFAQQVSEEQFTFNAADVFVLDWPLIASLLASMMSYVLVMLQFSSNENPQ
ncbi:uncharacterized protein LOC134541538 [Bacillus rossius redtenbacheri]|uniref:uncharacterized protein LOC134541538 n=1 Tax=Bacillus rossius redtenbacheri TaxID=93214 RepID=UPI002FDCAB47